ncbi:hypothetical protein B0J13DRAFT_621454 [Dactylonectria estremocensis]|uniref:CCHC-type domain-containing protein n=1 Tax=Dactylonectria estremocensis TaxID=1079267 RepID=A0A9P9J639_9HYPO|nr:hypothetical protein B0J13DRAFT_621454 [Dactylonectria estremocensis]
MSDSNGVVSLDALIKLLLCRRRTPPPPPVNVETRPRPRPVQPMLTLPGLQEPKQKPAKKPRGDEPITCHYCKKPGHRITKCPEKQREEANKAGRLAQDLLIPASLLQP